MTNAVNLVPMDERARDIVGGKKYDAERLKKSELIERALELDSVVEKWCGDQCVSGCGIPKLSYPGTLCMTDGSESSLTCICDYIIGAPQDIGDGVVQVRRMFIYARPRERLEDVFARSYLRYIRAYDVRGLTSRQYQDLEARVVVMWMQARGRFFFDSKLRDEASALYFDAAHNLGNGRRGGYLMRIGSDEFTNWVAAHAPSKADCKRRDSKILRTVGMAALNPEVSTGVEPGNLWDRRGDVIYISNGDSEIVRVSAEKVELVPNGTDDVVFLAGKTLRPWKLLDGPGEDPFKTAKVFAGANYESPHGMMIVRLWFLALFACLKAKPALVFTGKRRSGKTRMAEGISDLLGIENRCAAIQEKGEDDFWVSVDAGGLVTFDNVDTKNSWFGDAMQLACTKGGREKRKLYSEELRTFRSRAAIILTSNNPSFATESGLSDRTQICRLGPFDAKNGKKTDDAALTRDVEARRDAALTWVARTLSRALGDGGAVEDNVNMRHPDFADFAMRCARSLGCYQEGVNALKSAEFDKALFVLQNDRVANMIVDVLKAAGGVWSGTSTEMVAAIQTEFSFSQSEKGVSPTAVGIVLNKYLEELLVLFDGCRPDKRARVKRYKFTGFSQAYSANNGCCRDDQMPGDDVDDASSCDDAEDLEPESAPRLWDEGEG